MWSFIGLSQRYEILSQLKSLLNCRELNFGTVLFSKWLWITFNCNCSSRRHYWTLEHSEETESKYQSSDKNSRLIRKINTLYQNYYCLIFNRPMTIWLTLNKFTRKFIETIHFSLWKISHFNLVNVNWIFMKCIEIWTWKMNRNRKGSRPRDIFVSSFLIV